MKQALPISQWIVILFALLFSGVLKAQQNPAISLPAPGTRIPLDVQAGQTTLRICGLQPGRTYKAAALKVGPEQPAVFTLSAGNDDTQRRNRLRFTATAECQELVLESGTEQHSTALPLLLSVTCEDCPQERAAAPRKGDQADQVNLSVQPGVPAESLVRNTLVGGDCFEVSNITSSGPANAFGTFTNGSASIGIQNGLVMCTGNASILPGPNNQVSVSGNFGGNFGSNLIQDPDLATITPLEQFDVTRLEFDFVPTANKVQFEYVFGSEEYCEWVGNLIFNDAFGFFISGPGINGTKNLALLPNSNIPVSVNNINHLDNSQYYVNNSQSLLDLACILEGAANLQDIELDGWTTLLTATADVIPCETYHIKLVLADISDEYVASAVFLRANSFDAGGTAKAEAVYAGGQPAAYEACPSSYIRFSRDSSDINTPLEINFTVSGSATPGADFAPLNSPVVIPAGQQDVLVPVNILEDNTAEGQESIVVSIENACSCNQAEVEFLIADRLPVVVDLPDAVSVCAGKTLLLEAQAGGGAPPFSYLWNTGDSTSAVLIANEGYYILSVTDFCGSAGTDSVFASLTDLPVLNDTILFCPGDSVEIDGVVYTGPGTVLDTLPGANGGCDTLVTYVLNLLPRPTLSDTIQFCLGDTIIIGGKAYSTSGTVVDTLPGNGGGCDTIITYTLRVQEPPTRQETLRFCPGSFVLIGGQAYTAPGIVTDTLPGIGGGCDTVATYTLEWLPYPARSETVAFCPGETILIGGQPYTQPGIAIDTIPAISGCDTIVTYTLIYVTPAPSNVKTTCPADISLTVSGPGAVDYALPTVDSDCPCPGVSLELKDGLAPGSIFPVGVTNVCYQATDSCGNSASCCFRVTLSETQPCDVKTIGCLKFELLSIEQDAKQSTTYRIRVTNSCTTELLYAAFELPNGIVAVEPANNSLYNTPGGRTYAVRNPNYSPFYSIRYSPVNTGISGGASDIFEYTLPPRSLPNYIHAVAKVATQTYYEAYLNTFFCPVGKKQVENRDAFPDSGDRLLVFPNPAATQLFADLSAWPNETLQLRVFDSRGVAVLHQRVQGTGIYELQLPAELAGGLYFLEMQTENGARQVARFVVQR